MDGQRGRIHVGIGGWHFEPWRQTFYPPGTPASQELAHASRRLTMIEVNGTFYRTQQPSTFAKWHDETPEGFVFSLKAARYTTQKRVLAEAGDSVQAFLGSGLTRLRDKLGPLLWQFAPTKAFDADDFAAFLALLPDELDGLRLRHVVEVRHPSFLTPRLLDLLRGLVVELNLAVVIVTHDLGVARLLADRLLVMKQGQVVESGLTDRVLDDPHHPYTQLLVSSVLQN